MNGFAGKMFGIKNQVLIILVVMFLLLTATYAHGNPEAKFGDINNDGVVDIKDVALVAKHILNIEKLDPDQQELADVNEDGVIDVKDVNIITKYWLGLIDALPTTKDSHVEDKDESEEKPEDDEATENDEDAEDKDEPADKDEPDKSPPDHVYENDEKSPADHVYNS